MNLVGGYQIVDFKNIDFARVNDFEIPGIYDLIEGTNKVLLITGIVIDEIEQNDVYVSKQTYGSDFIINLYGYTLYIQDNDVVTKTTKNIWKTINATQSTVVLAQDGFYKIVNSTGSYAEIDIKNAQMLFLQYTHEQDPSAVFGGYGTINDSDNNHELALSINNNETIYIRIKDGVAFASFNLEL